MIWKGETSGSIRNPSSYPIHVCPTLAGRDLLLEVEADRRIRRDDITWTFPVQRFERKQIRL
jgi:hypothetical protein